VYSTLCNAHVKMHFSGGSHGVADRASRLGGLTPWRTSRASPSKRMLRIATTATMETVAFTAPAGLEFAPHHRSLTHRDAMIKRTPRLSERATLRDLARRAFPNLQRVPGEVSSFASRGRGGEGGGGGM